jgi:hypothetical protein
MQQFFGNAFIALNMLFLNVIWRNHSTGIPTWRADAEGRARRVRISCCIVLVMCVVLTGGTYAMSLISIIELMPAGMYCFPVCASPLRC